MDRYDGIICVSIISRDTDGAIVRIGNAEKTADILELRLDMMDEISLERMIDACSKPTLITFRTKKEGGAGNPDYGRILHLLRKAESLGSNLIDIEWSLPLEIRSELIRNIRDSKIVLSKHIMHGTPSADELETLMNRMTSSGADIVKIVTKANTIKDNLIIFELLRRAKERDINIISFSMGEKGLLSRVLGRFLGSVITFCSLRWGEESADGQIPAEDMRRIWSLILC